MPIFNGANEEITVRNGEVKSADAVVPTTSAAIEALKNRKLTKISREAETAGIKNGLIINGKVKRIGKSSEYLLDMLSVEN